MAREPSGGVPAAPIVILTIGHSNHSLDEFLGLLAIHRVSLLVDVRTLPGSRRNPHFARDALAAALARAGIEYVHVPELGGLRRPLPHSTNTAWRHEGFRGFADHMQTASFESGLEFVLSRAAGAVPALMCAEAVPWRCHRSLIADGLVARGARVEHILGPHARRPHVLSPGARVMAGRVSYPGEPAPRDPVGVGARSSESARRSRPRE